MKSRISLAEFAHPNQALFECVETLAISGALLLIFAIFNAARIHAQKPMMTCEVYAYCGLLAAQGLSGILLLPNLHVPNSRMHRLFALSVGSSLATSAGFVWQPRPPSIAALLREHEHGRVLPQSHSLTVQHFVFCCCWHLRSSFCVEEASQEVVSINILQMLASARPFGIVWQPRVVQTQSNQLMCCDQAMRP